MTRGRIWAALVLGAGAVALVANCGGGQPPAEAPDEPTDEMGAESVEPAAEGSEDEAPPSLDEPLGASEGTSDADEAGDEAEASPEEESLPTASVEVKGDCKKGRCKVACGADGRCKQDCDGGNCEMSCGLNS
jgi:hypothetical protein